MLEVKSLPDFYNVGRTPATVLSRMDCCCASPSCNTLNHSDRSAYDWVVTDGASKSERENGRRSSGLKTHPRLRV